MYLHVYIQIRRLHIYIFEVLIFKGMYYGPRVFPYTVGKSLHMHTLVIFIFGGEGELCFHFESINGSS